MDMFENGKFETETSQAPAARKAWSTPKVILSTASDAENTPVAGGDGAGHSEITS